MAVNVWGWRRWVAWGTLTVLVGAALAGAWGCAPRKVAPVTGLPSAAQTVVNSSTTYRVDQGQPAARPAAAVKPCPLDPGAPCSLGTPGSWDAPATRDTPGKR